MQIPDRYIWNRSALSIDQLSLYFCQKLKPSDYALLQKLTTLQHIDIGCSNISNAALYTLTSLVALKNISADGLLITPLHLESFAKSLKNLECINLDFNSAMTSAGFVKAAPSLWKLKTIHLTSCDWLDDAALRALCKHMTQITRMSIDDCRNTTDEGVKLLASHPTLTSLVVYNSFRSQITSKTLAEHFKAHGPNIKLSI